MIAKNRQISIHISSRRMCKSCSEIVEPGHGFETNIMFRVDFADLCRDDIIGILHIG